MSAAARSIVIFGGYLAVLGASLLLAPAFALPLAGFPPSADVWIRVVGALLLALAYADVRLGREEVVTWLRISVHVRSAVAVLFAAFVLLGLAPRMLLLFAFVDLAGALWTAAALRTGALVPVQQGAERLPLG